MSPISRSTVNDAISSLARGHTTVCMRSRGRAWYTLNAGYQVDVMNRSTNVDLTNYVKSGEFDLVNVHQRRRVLRYSCCLEPYPGISRHVCLFSCTGELCRRHILHTHSSQNTILHVQRRLSVHDDERTHTARLLSTARLWRKDCTRYHRTIGILCVRTRDCREDARDER
jgi:hypothetical protein